MTAVASVLSKYKHFSPERTEATVLLDEVADGAG
jgi:hypothetical protein